MADINPSQEISNLGSDPDQLTAWGGKVLFSARTRDAGLELWGTDGTDAGTQRLVDACPGRCSTTIRSLASLSGGALLILDGKLWRSDGTPAGTVALTDGGEALSAADSGTNDVAVLAGIAYFSACAPTRGCGGWRSDGTQAGTVPIGPFLSSGGAPRLYRAGNDRVYDLAYRNGDQELWKVQGASAPARVKVFSSAAGALSNLVVAGNQAFFLQGRDLWTSDGTNAGTRRLRTFRALPLFGAWIKPAAGRVYLLADADGVHGQQIWRSDGTPEGTLQMTDFSSSLSLENLDSKVVDAVGDTLVFQARRNSDESTLWAVSPATAPAAVDLCASRCKLTFDSSSLTEVGGRLLLVAQDGAHGGEPWITDGTPAGTALLADTCPRSCSGGSGVVYPRTGSGAVFFQAAGTLWVTDGTAAGTRQYSDGGVAISTDPPQLVQLGDRVYFSAETADYSSPTYYGPELWTSDGQPGGTRLVTDVETAKGSSDPTLFTQLGDGVFFLACTGEPFTGQELWRGPQVLTTGSGSDCVSTSSIQQLVRAGGHLFLWRNVQDNFKTTLWASDGTAAGTIQLTSHNEDFSRGEIPLVPFQDKVYWVEGDSEVPFEVWTSDGTVAGTRKAFDLPDATQEPIHIEATSDALYVFSYSVHPSQAGFQVWRKDGTTASPQKVWSSGLRLAFGGLHASGSTLLLFLMDNDNAYELWKVDGSGGVHLRDFLGRSRQMVSYKGASYFFNQRTSLSDDFGLWRTDGTAAGTTLVYHFPYPGDVEPGNTEVYAPTVLADRLYFAVDDGVHGPELWSSDGTSAGTALVKDLFPGPTGSSPAELTASSGRLFFSADDGVHGFELFQSDGTAAGTRLVEDLSPETGSSYPTGMTAAGNRLYFAADDGIHGIEPWSYPLDGPAGCQPTATSLCLSGGRFRVELEWRTADGFAGAGHAVGLSADTGYFWFFDPGNVETMVKVLDGRGLNSHFWIFYGALSNVEYTLTVTDTQTGLVRHYFNPVGQFGSVGDTQGFGPLGEYASTLTAAPSPLPRTAKTTGPASSAGCEPGPTRLCLQGNRFAVEATWKDFSGNIGAGQAVALTGDTGYFWFFDSANVEVILKVLDAQSVNGKFWVYYGALSNVEYTLRVTDTATGTVKTYTNPAGRFASTGDTDAF
jgi:ELWxxDGT repeat protein